MDKFDDLEDYIRHGSPLKNEAEYQSLKQRIEESANKNYMTGHPNTVPEVAKRQKEWQLQGCPMPSDWFEDVDLPEHEFDFDTSYNFPVEYYIDYVKVVYPRPRGFPATPTKHIPVLRSRYTHNTFIDYGVDGNKKRKAIWKRRWRRVKIFFKNVYTITKFVCKKCRKKNRR